MADLRFRKHFKLLISAPSGAGKTTFCAGIIRNQRELCEVGQHDQVLFCYNQWQKIYDDLSNEGHVTEWHNDVPTAEWIQDKTAAFKNSPGGTLLVIDDFASRLTKDIGLLFTVLARHCNCSVILMTQNIFVKDPIFREISLNSTYVVVFKSPRDTSQVNTFIRQVCPLDSTFLREAFRAATIAPHSYMLFDLHQTCPELARYRTNILPHEYPMRAYIRKES